MEDTSNKRKCKDGEKEDTSKKLRSVQDDTEEFQTSKPPPREQRKTLQQMMEEYDKTEASRQPFKAVLHIHALQKAVMYASTVEELWARVTKELPASIYRGKFLGLARKNKQKVLYPPDTDIPPGSYVVVVETIYMDSDDMEDIILEAVKKLKANGPLVDPTISKLEQKLLILFTHSSLHQEGNTVTKSETEAVATLLADKDPLRHLEDSEKKGACSIVYSLHLHTHTARHMTTSKHTLSLMCAPHTTHTAHRTPHTAQYFIHP